MAPVGPHNLPDDLPCSRRSSSPSTPRRRGWRPRCAYEILVQAPALRIAQLREQAFGPSSEKIEREVARLRLVPDDLEVARVSA